jgi:hypothetical protein
VAFAARDPSGTETLFYRIGDDGGAPSWSDWIALALLGCWGSRPNQPSKHNQPSDQPTDIPNQTGSAAFASSRAAIPESGPQEAVGGAWDELPPGHYISGKTPRLRQFALTPEQLQVGAAGGGMLFSAVWYSVCGKLREAA